MAREDEFQTFVLRIWVEEADHHGNGTLWRGHITAVATGERNYVEDLDSILVFLIPRLEVLGARVGLRWRVHAWLRQHRL